MNNQKINSAAKHCLDSHNDFYLFFELGPTPYLVLRANPPEYTIVAFNKSYLNAVGREGHQILGQSVFDAFPPTTEKDKNDFTSSFVRVMEERAQDILGVQRYDVPSEDGFIVKYWCPINSPIFAEDGSVKYILQRVEDITDYVLLKENFNELKNNNQFNQSHSLRMESEIIRASQEVKESNRKIKLSEAEQKRKKEELINLNEELKEVHRLKTEFFSNISHEFRTPLTLMLGPIEEALNDLNMHPLNRNRLEIAHRNAIRLLKLVNNLLDYSRFEAGRYQVTFQATDIAKLTRELASSFDSAISKSGLQFIIDCEPLPEAIYVDQSAWEKIVLNLLSNAFKHTFNGKIEIQLRWLGSSIALIIKDTGIGIPQDQHSKIFDRFHRVANVKSRSHEGSGIGLSLVKELVNLHQGTIQVASKLEQGTTFTIILPAGKDHLPYEFINTQPQEYTTKIDNRSYINEALHWVTDNENNLQSDFDENIQNPQEFWPSTRPHQSKKAQILLVEDNIDMRQYIHRLLVPFCDVQMASNGEEALIAIRKKFPDLILSDVMMPVMTGFELVNEIRKDNALKDIPIILLSARAGEEAKVEGLQVGADDYLVKPFSRQELLARVKSNLDLNRMRKHSQEVLRLFISNLSHELRTPLNAIIGYSSLILKGLLHKENQNEYVGIISKASKYLLALINDILELSQIEVGKFTLHLEWIDLKEFINNVQTLLIELAKDKNIKLHFEIDPKLTTINTDPKRLNQIMINLINNAIKFNRQDGNVNVEITQSPDEKWLIFIIKDTGLGIPENKLKELFTEFYRVDNALNSEGTGLGLALSKKIIQLFGGTISVESHEGEGSTFTFTIPKEIQ